MNVALFRINMLLFNENYNNEVHLKIGGDHGGGSFKMSYQIVNVANPSSKDNTLVFSLIGAKDCRIDIKTGLTRFAQQIDELQNMMRRLSNIFYFMLEDESFHIDIGLASEVAKKIQMNMHLSVILPRSDKCTDLADMDIRIGKVSDEIRFVNDAIQTELFHNPDVEAMIKQMYANRLLEPQTELTEKVN